MNVGMKEDLYFEQSVFQVDHLKELETVHKSLIVRGKKMHVEIFGNQQLSAVLFLHGGPGESCYEFVYHQAKRLSEIFHLVAIDQRGVCRSEEINSTEEFGLRDLVEDCEELRTQLGINKWAVIGHSFGGYVSLLYASAYPDSITKVIFECPTFDFSWTSKSLLRRASSVFLSLGDPNKSAECKSLATSDLQSKELFDQYLRLGEELGEKKAEIYRVNNLTSIDYSAYTDEEWELFADRTEIHLNRLREEGRMFESIVPLLSTLSVPSMLILGEADPVTCDSHIQAYDQISNGNKIMVENCGHTPHAERPDLYGLIVSTFLLPDK
ncbi:alpha/beta fold hydrolase [Paenibacillus sp. NPDC058177]|uniref:alpha/beta fold hydrolase n=1 Tax=Paenibacillus sp. NPDC058177 TaxID=3346369 RepID=UPI0036D7818E